jgi:transcriptional regulator of arginine metabolism
MTLGGNRGTTMQNKRHREILNIVKEREIANQEELIAALRERSFVVTQPTVSRDITRLGLAKSLTEDGVYCYRVPQQLKTAKFESVFAHAIKSITAAMNTVVIKTHTGMASAVCVPLEMMDIPAIVGTIAGDDTIFVMTRSERDAAELVTKLKKLL